MRMICCLLFSLGSFCLLVAGAEKADRAAERRLAMMDDDTDTRSRTDLPGKRERRGWDEAALLPGGSGGLLFPLLPAAAGTGGGGGRRCSREEAARRREERASSETESR